MKEPKVLEMLHEIREKHFEETKKLSAEKFLMTIHEQAEAVRKKVVKHP